jgi:hypothetical protein
VTRQGSTFSERTARRAIGGWAVAAAIAGCALGAAPVGATDDPPEVHVVPGVEVAAPADDGHPGPGGGRPEAPDDDDDRPRPVAPRPTAGTTPAGADVLAVRALRVPASVSAASARRDGVTVSFVPRPGSLVAEVRLVRVVGAARRPVARRVVAARAGRRVAVRLRSPALRPGRYEVVVRAGASLRTLGAPVAAGVRVG